MFAVKTITKFYLCDLQNVVHHNPNLSDDGHLQPDS